MGVDELVVLAGRSGSLRDQPKEFIESRNEVDAIFVGLEQLPHHSNGCLCCRACRSAAVARGRLAVDPPRGSLPVTLRYQVRWPRGRDRGRLAAGAVFRADDLRCSNGVGACGQEGR